MNIKLRWQYVYILSCSLWIAATISYSSQSQSSKENKEAQAKSNTLLSKNGGSTVRLKYTTGIRAILEDSKGNIWFGSYNEGACLLQDGKLQYFTTANGLSNNQVRNIYEDKNGFIWFECGKGLSFYDGQKLTVYRDRNYDFTQQWKLTKNDLWFKGDEIEGYNNLEKKPGVYQYDGNKLFYRTFPITQKSNDEIRFTYAVSTEFVKGKNGRLWLGTYGSVIGYNSMYFTIIDQKMAGTSLHIRSIMEDSKGNLWIGNNGIGILKYDGKKIINFTEIHKLKTEDTNGNSLERVFSIGEDTSGNIWFGTVGSGVWRYDGKSVKNFTEKDGLESNHIWRIYQSKHGELWFGGASPSGVYRFNGHSFERKY